MLKKRVMDEVDRCAAKVPAVSQLRDQIIACIACLTDMYRSGGKLLICGNGGSAADSLHIVGELMKGFSMRREIPAELQGELRQWYPEDAAFYIESLQQAVPAISLSSETGFLTAYGNDVVPELAYAQEVLGYGRPGDVLLAISTSGSSTNIVHAARIAKVMGLTVISMTGQSGGELRAISDILLNVPETITHHVQELHVVIYHLICQGLEIDLFGKA